MLKAQALRKFPFFRNTTKLKGLLLVIRRETKLTRSNCFHWCKPKALLRVCPERLMQRVLVCHEKKLLLFDLLKRWMQLWYWKKLMPSRLIFLPVTATLTSEEKQKSTGLYKCGKKQQIMNDSKEMMV